MKPNSTKIKFATTLFVAFSLFLMSNRASAIDAAYSRKGGFTGFGMSGGGALFLDGDPGGDIGLTLQAGAGASSKFTVAFNLDGHLQISSNYLSGMMVPGPSISFFVFKGLYIHIDMGVALTFLEDSDFTVGMDAGAGIGYEIFINTNWAAYMTVDFDYFLMYDMSDILMPSLWIGLRYY
jgi:hypothetical protein